MSELPISSTPARGAGTKRAKQAHVWERDKLDWYIEPEFVTTGLLNVERFVGGIWDPACGGGNIMRAAQSSNNRGFFYGTDLVDRGAPFFHRTLNFLDYDGPALAPNIICNPPYFRAAGTEAFIRKALALATGKVAVFTDVRFITGSGRANGIFSEHPPHRIWMITPRPSCPPGAYLASGGKAGGGTADYVWLIFDLTAPKTDTRFDWLRCQR